MDPACSDIGRQRWIEESIPVEDKEVVQTLTPVVETASLGVQGGAIGCIGTVRIVMDVPF